MRTHLLRTRRFQAPLVVLLALTTFGCASLNKKERGAIIGGAAGAVAGGVIGNQTGSTARGAIIGAVIGGAAGAIIGHQMDQRAKTLQQNIPGATVTRVGEGIAVVFDSGLMFDFDSDVLKSTARTNLDALADNMNEYDDSNLLILGHTDNVGSDSYNYGLSERRAAAASRYLSSRGVARIDTRGLGENEPIASNDDEEGRRLNRRVEIAIYASEEARAAARRQAAGG
jgi:outer membrane protein OmpA-like peptidoglycan-associated protein